MHWTNPFQSFIPSSNAAYVYALLLRIFNIYIWDIFYFWDVFREILDKACNPSEIRNAE